MARGPVLNAGGGPPGDVRANEVIVIPDCLTALQCDDLWWLMAQRVETENYDGLINGCPLVSVLPSYSKLAGQLIGDLASRLGLSQTNAYETGLVLYREGDIFPEHTDIVDGSSWSYGRTVSFSIMLADPGQDFTGGEFYANGKPVPLKRGDLVGFTAMTPHRVSRIASGARLVWIAFGEVSR